MVDSSGNLYATTGNPDPVGGRATTYDYSDSILKLDPSTDFSSEPQHSPEPAGWFEPPTWEADSNSDLDLGSAGPELLPEGLIFQSYKRGTGFLVHTATMGPGANAAYEGKACEGGGSWGGDAYDEGVIYVACTGGVTALKLNSSAPSFSVLWHGPSDANGTPIVSGGHVWVLSTPFESGGGTKLYGLDPATGATQVTETLPSAVVDHFASPSAAGGRLFVSTGSTVTAYQIAQLVPEETPAPEPTTTGGTATGGAAGTTTTGGTATGGDAGTTTTGGTATGGATGRTTTGGVPAPGETPATTPPAGTPQGGAPLPTTAPEGTPTGTPGGTQGATPKTQARAGRPRVEAP